mgnify:FL=1
MFVFPINRVPDEMNHARMTWEVLHKPTLQSFNWMDEISSDAHVNPSDYEKVLNQKLDMENEPYQVTLNLKSLSFLPQLIGMTLGSLVKPTVGMIIYMGRFFNALAYIIGTFCLIKYFKYGKLALFFISLQPIMVQQASSLSYDVMNYLEIMLAIGFITNLAYKKTFSNKDGLLLVPISLLLLATKPNNFLLLCLIPFIPLNFEGIFSFLNTPLRVIKQTISKFKYVFYLVLLLAIFSVLYYLMRDNGGVIHYIQVLSNTLLKQHMNGDLNTILTIGMFGFFGNFTIQLPLWLIFINVCVLFLVFLSSEEAFFTQDFATVSSILFPIQVLATVTVMYLQWTPIVLGNGANISVGSQGRYFTPFLILFLPIIANLGNLKIKQHKLLTITVVTLLFNYLISLYLLIPFYWVF